MVAVVVVVLCIETLMSAESFKGTVVGLRDGTVPAGPGWTSGSGF